jgi:hypothetical protein
MPNVRAYEPLAGQAYLRNSSDLTLGTSKSLALMHGGIEFLLINECYMRNVDAFRHMSVYDYDEIIMPNRIEGDMRDTVNLQRFLSSTVFFLCRCRSLLA